MKSSLFPSRSGSVRSRPIGAGALKNFAVAGTVFCLLGIGTAGANETSAESGEGEIFAVVRVAAPKQLTEKIMAVARKIQPGPQTEALPFMLGGMLGDPTLEGVSATENIGLALIANGEDITPILLLKLTEESPLRASLPNFEMTLLDFGGWTFGLQQGASATLLEGRQEALISAVRAPRRYDLELTADGPALARKLREAYQGFPDTDEMGNMIVRPLIEALATEADAVQDFRVGFNLSGEEIQQFLFMEAVPGSAMAAFLNQKRPENMDFARFIRADEAVAYLGGVDVQATRQYFDHFIDVLSGDTEGPGGELWQKFHDIGVQYLDRMDGRSGGVLSLDAMALQMVSIAPTSMSDEELLALLAETVGTMGGIPTGDTEEGSPMTKYELLPNQLDVDGVAVHVMRTEVKFDPEAAAEIEEQVPGFLMPEQRHDMHYAVVGGYMVNTSDIARMKELIGAIQKDEAVENNLATLIQVDEENLFEFQVNLLRYFGGIMAVMMPPDMSAVLQRLESRNLKPMTGEASARNGVAEVGVSIPVDTVAAVYQEVTAYMAAQREKEQEEQEEQELSPANP
ncbi:MAG: hypothetical protein WD490_05695 [Opitutales bacterium]